MVREAIGDTGLRLWTGRLREGTLSWMRLFTNSEEVHSNTAQPSIEALRKVVPGDIWVKDSATKSETVMNDHIAIVAFVPSDPAVVDPKVFMDQMILIEGEYTNKIQSVVKLITVGNYNNGELKSTDNGGFLYPGILIPASGIGLNCQMWAIRRLK